MLIEKIREGKYHVRINGFKIPGMILGGNGKYVAEVANESIGVFQKRKDAAVALADRWRHAVFSFSGEVR